MWKMINSSSSSSRAAASPSSSYLMKTYAALTYVVVFWALGFAVQHYQANMLQRKKAGVVVVAGEVEEDAAMSMMNPSFWDNFGLSCISNVLMGGLYLVVYMGDIAFRKFYHGGCNNNNGRPSLVETERPSGSNSGTTTTTTTMASSASPAVFCVEEEEQPPREQQGANDIQPEQPEHHRAIEMPCNAHVVGEEEGMLLLRITPSRLWYYMYTTGWGVFCMAYTLHGAHWVSSMCLCAGSLFCSIWGAMREKQVNSTGKRAAMSFLMAINVASVCTCTSLLGKQANLLWRSWVVEIACPLLTPFWLWESKDKMLPVNMHKQSLVMFGLPFTSMISAGYLSMYIPLQECVTAAAAVVVSGGANNTTTTAVQRMWTPLVTEESLMGQSVWSLLLCGVIVPTLLYTGFVLYASGFQKVDMQVLCANSLWTVLAMRLWMYNNGAFGSVAIMALLGWFVALLYVLLHHFETDRIREWRDVYGDILLADDFVDVNPSLR